ncbi:MarR family winged helix-turn-helix transcriptional regulator [Rhizobium oryzicola]|uniref:MarR family transcriptional regulator n=1 Tax=Rhizobium oryzicola TaxID=1232668 RepID=A0ABT8T1N0_9HYPH|nr:MarR family transcriptional regulator [Rhizobium oryzicola]MDO1584314.1 MarR family transcriptional regulator [Rhizobium oryzicola]
MSNNLCHCILLRKATRKVSAYYDEALAPFGVNIAQFSLLRNIRRLAPVSLTDLAEHVELDRSTVGRNTKVLARMNLLHFAGGEDKREALISITDKASSLLNEAGPAWDSVQEMIEERLGPEKTEQLRDLLGAL